MLGAVTGPSAVAAFIFVPLGNVQLELFGVCLGGGTLGNCSHTAISPYVYPGLIFGIAFALVLARAQLLRFAGAIIFVAAALLSHAIAYETAMQMSDLVSGHWGEIIIGATAGAVGGGLLALVAAIILPLGRWPSLLAAGAVLGIALPIALGNWGGGLFVFYALWQAGYAACLAANLPQVAVRDRLQEA